MATHARGDALDSKELGDALDGDAPSLSMVLLQPDMLQTATHAHGDAPDGKALGDAPDSNAPSRCVALLQPAMLRLLRSLSNSQTMLPHAVHGVTPYSRDDASIHAWR
ncbi:hypothetical protein AMTR_s00042p00205170 [Amborella trichopoda]|uniref:Uncharacterized protein n=1 Tax=Amborella trichopoda TaxID=13333 RepID=W1P9D8_AMBTC|nr:hypothetical protein AMTR_s00042p00205170 [Amborella trichopoda]